MKFLLQGLLVLSCSEEIERLHIVTGDDRKATERFTPARTVTRNHGHQSPVATAPLPRTIGPQSSTCLSLPISRPFSNSDFPFSCASFK